MSSLKQVAGTRLRPELNLLPETQHPSARYGQICFLVLQLGMFQICLIKVSISGQGRSRFLIVALKKIIPGEKPQYATIPFLHWIGTLGFSPFWRPQSPWRRCSGCIGSFSNWKVKRDHPRPGHGVCEAWPHQQDLFRSAHHRWLNHGKWWIHG
jgi:hypothetical protein